MPTLFRTPLLLCTSLILAPAACGGTTPEPETPAPSPAATTPAAPAPAPAATPAASTASASAPSDAWAGENQAKAPANPAGPADSATPETRTMDVIRKLVMERRKAVRDCYEKARRENRDLQGDVVIHFVLDPKGRVKQAELNLPRSTLTNASVVACAIDTIKHIDFPPSSRGMDTSVNYPYNFTP